MKQRKALATAAVGSQMPPQPTQSKKQPQERNSLTLLKSQISNNGEIFRTQPIQKQLNKTTQLKKKSGFGLISTEQSLEHDQIIPKPNHHKRTGSDSFNNKPVSNQQSSLHIIPSSHFQSVEISANTSPKADILILRSKITKQPPHCQRHVQELTPPHLVIKPQPLSKRDISLKPEEEDFQSYSKDHSPKIAIIPAQLNHYKQSSQQLQSNLQFKQTNVQTNVFQKLKPTNLSHPNQFNNTTNFNNVTIKSQDRYNSVNEHLQNNNVDNTVTPNSVSVKVQQPLSTKNGLKKQQSQQQIVQKPMRPVLYHSKNTSSVGAASFSSTNSRFNIKRPRNPADLSVSSKGSLESQSIIPAGVNRLKQTLQQTAHQMMTVQTVHLNMLGTDQHRQSSSPSKNNFINGQINAQQPQSASKPSVKLFGQQSSTQIKALISPKQASKTKPSAVFSKSEKKAAQSGVPQKGISSGQIQPKALQNIIKKSGPKKSALPPQMSKQQSVSGFLSQSVKQSSISAPPAEIPSEAASEEQHSSSNQKTMKSQKLNDVQEEQLEDSGPNTNRDNFDTQKSVEVMDKRKQMQNSVSHQQLVKALNFGLNPTNSQGSLARSKDNLLNNASMSDLTLTQQQRFSGAQPLPTKSNNTIINIDTNGGEISSTDQIVTPKYISLKQQLKAHIHNQQLYNNKPVSAAVNGSLSERQIEQGQSKNIVLDSATSPAQVHRQQTQPLSSNPQQPSSSQAVDLPMTGRQASIHFSSLLSEYEKIEIQGYSLVYFVGSTQAVKISGSSSKQNNYGYDDERGDYNVVINDHLCFRFEVVDKLGSGSFGQAIKCFDHKLQQMVAVKVIRNKKRFQHQASIELKILKLLNEKDKLDENNIVRILDYDVFRRHLIISFELLSMNLYEFIKANNFQGVSLGLVRRFAIQILQALKFQRDLKVIHCDLKPENILLKQPNKSGIKIIDYGSSCMQNQRIYTYIQSRFYRAPEIILGIPYTSAIDMWSFGCILAELYSGYPLFPGENEQDQLSYIMQLKDVPDASLIELSTRRNLFFDPKDNTPIIVANSRGRKRRPNTKNLSQILNNCTDKLFLDFIERCLDWSPIARITPLEALQHEWILSGLPQKVLIHHQQMFKGADRRDSLRDATFTDIQGFPSDANQKSIQEIVKELKRITSSNTLNALDVNPPSPQSVVAALAAIKQNGKIKNSQTFKAEYQTTTSVKPNLFGMNLPISKTYDVGRVVEVPETQVKPIRNNILYQVPMKQRKSLTIDVIDYQVKGNDIKKTSQDYDYSSGRSGQSNICGSDNSQNSRILIPLQSVKFNEARNLDKNATPSSNKQTIQLLDIQVEDQEELGSNNNGCRVHTESDSPAMLPDEDEGITQKHQTQRVPMSLIKQLETPSKRDSEGNKFLTQQSQPSHTLYQSQQQDVQSESQNTENTKIEWLSVYRPQNKHQPALTNYLKHVQTSKRIIKNMTTNSHQHQQPLRLFQSGNSQLVQEQKLLQMTSLTNNPSSKEL